MSREQLRLETWRLWKAWQDETDPKLKEERRKEFQRARIEFLRMRNHETN